VSTIERNVGELARQFWARARLPEGYPRDIESGVALVLPMAIIKLPVVTTSEVSLWLTRNRVAAEVNQLPLDLMGCLIAYAGHGITFVGGGDSPEEQRLTIAHEAAHFIVHYMMPRQRALTALGASIKPVLDGERLATPAERVEGVLSGMRIGAHIHLLPRGITDDRVALAEVDADNLGLELVAPQEAVSAFLRTRHLDDAGPLEQAIALQMKFGVPAQAMMRRLAETNRPRPSGFTAATLAILRGGNERT